jgi:hypothetical protein
MPCLVKAFWRTAAMAEQVLALPGCARSWSYFDDMKQILFGSASEPDRRNVGRYRLVRLPERVGPRVF